MPGIESASRLVPLAISLLVGVIRPMVLGWRVEGDGLEEEEEDGVGVMVALVRLGVSGLLLGLSLVLLWLSIRCIIRSSKTKGRSSTHNYSI